MGERGSSDPSPGPSFFTKIGMWRRVAAHEAHGLARRAVGRDPGRTLIGRPAVTDVRLAMHRRAARLLIEHGRWTPAVQAFSDLAHDPDEVRRAAAMLPDDFEEVVVFAIRAANELLRQSVDGPVIERPDLVEGLLAEARLNRMSDEDVFAEAAELVPALRTSTVGAGTTGESPEDAAAKKKDLGRLQAAQGAAEPLRSHARAHGPVPAILFDVTVRAIAGGRGAQ